MPADFFAPIFMDPPPTHLFVCMFQLCDLDGVILIAMSAARASGAMQPVENLGARRYFVAEDWNRFHAGWDPVSDEERMAATHFLSFEVLEIIEDSFAKFRAFGRNPDMAGLAEHLPDLATRINEYLASPQVHLAEDQPPQSDGLFSWYGGVKEVYRLKMSDWKPSLMVSQDGGPWQPALLIRTQASTDVPEGPGGPL